MNTIKKSTLALLLTAGLFLPLPGQEPANPDDSISYSEIVRNMYPLDQSLVSGFRYNSYYTLHLGHPYLATNLFIPGSLTTKGQTYSDVSLRFNIHNQQLELLYKNHGGYNWVYLIMDFISSFRIGEIQFQKQTISDRTGYYQVVQTGSFTCYFLWKKITSINGEQLSFHYATPVMFLANPVTKVPFKGNRQFAHYFGYGNKTSRAVRRLLRKNSFSFRDASPTEIITNMQAVNSFLENNPEP